MGVYDFQQVKTIIFTNPNASLVKKAQDMRVKYSRQTHGTNYKADIRKINYVEDNECYSARKQYALSNIDLWKRVLNKEDEVFTTTGGSEGYIGLSESDKARMYELTDNVIHGLNLHMWVKTYWLPAYRADPMGLIFMEADEVLSADGDNFNTPRCYPTYKSTADIFDYLPNGRDLEYVCFNITQKQLKQYGLVEYGAPDSMQQFATGTTTSYYRFVDDVSDTIYKKENNTIAVVAMRQKNPIMHDFGKVPAFIISDLFQYDDPECFGSPLQFVIEVAEAFLHDRSVRELHKKLHGFPKAVEPLLSCSTCFVGGTSTGFVGGTACPDCTIPGQSQGTGKKLKTTPADVARFPLEMLKEITGFDIQKIFAYITPDIEGLGMMNISLVDFEELIRCTYWGSEAKRSTGFNGKQSVDDTATKTLVNLQPEISRLNSTADSAQSAMNKIANFIGRFWFGDTWGDQDRANIMLSRNYILELPEDVLLVYQDMLKSPATPEVELDEQFKKYIRAKYKANPERAAIELKFFELQPFRHVSPTAIEASLIVPTPDKIACRYYGEWMATLTDGQKANTKKDKLRVMFAEYIAPKVQAIEEQQKADMEAQQALKKQTNLN